MLMLYGTHTGKWTKLREEMRVAGANYPGIVFAVALKPTLGLVKTAPPKLLVLRQS